MATALILSPSLLDEMLAHVNRLFPEEACGLVGGVDGHAARLYPVENVRHSPVAFEMEPVQQIKALLAMEAEGLELIAIYHSHPNGPARPSTTDVANAYYPDAVQLIISLADRQRPSVRAFTIVDGIVTEGGWEEESTDYTD
jgi:proteasome lid subunit RPN8/RPN11